MVSDGKEAFQSDYVRMGVREYFRLDCHLRALVHADEFVRFVVDQRTYLEDDPTRAFLEDIRQDIQTQIVRRRRELIEIANKNVLAFI